MGSYLSTPPKKKSITEINIERAYNRTFIDIKETIKISEKNKDEFCKINVYPSNICLNVIRDLESLGYTINSTDEGEITVYLNHPIDEKII
jgi:hypothetical protein